MQVQSLGHWCPNLLEWSPQDAHEGTQADYSSLLAAKIIAKNGTNMQYKKTELNDKITKLKTSIPAMYKEGFKSSDKLLACNLKQKGEKLWKKSVTLQNISPSMAKRWIGPQDAPLHVHHSQDHLVKGFHPVRHCQVGGAQ